MMDLLVILGALVSVVIIALLLYELLSAKGMALSWRNIFLLGYLVFFGTGTMFLAMEDFSNPYYIPSPAAIGMLCFWTPTFLAVFLMCYHIGRKWKKAALLIPTTSMVISAPMVLITVGVAMTLALITTLIPIDSYIGLLMAQFRDGWLGVGVGLCVYYMLSRKLNPIAFGMLLVVFPIAAVISTTGTIGRRGILSMIFIIGWIGYFFYLRYCSRQTRLIVVGSGIVIMVIGLTIFSSFRGQWLSNPSGTRLQMVQARLTQFVRAFTSPKIDRELIWSLVVTDPAIYAGYVYDHVPHSMASDPFHGAIYLITNPIPRRIWSTKPEGLGIIIQRRLNLQFNVGPGIIGHGYYEGLHLGVLGYAIFFGLYCAVIDTAVRQRSDNPLFLIAVGASLGNVLGLARGETFLFLLLTLGAFASSMGTFFILRLIAGPVLNTMPPLPHPAARLGVSPSAQFFEEGRLAESQALAHREAEYAYETQVGTDYDPEAAHAYWDGGEPPDRTAVERTAV